MTKKQLCRGLFASLLLCAVFVLGTACEGGLCAATSAALSDADSDCTDDSSDTCRTIYNPQQFDGDGDGAGYECDSDDTDETIAMGLVRDPAEILGETTEGGLGVFAAAPTYTLPTEPPSVVQELDFGKEEGFYFLVSCDGNFLGKLSQDAEDDLSVYNEDSDYASDSSDFSIFNPWSVYGRSFTACSAFNEDASYPPQIYFRSFSDVQDYFVGYLTTNNTLDYQKNTCQTLESLSIFYDGCL